MDSDSAMAALRATLDARGLDFDQIARQVQELAIETPSWGYGNSGTRFKVFTWPGAARNLHEKLADAAMVHKVTGACPTVALHIPWDMTDDWEAAREEAEGLGVQVGAINPNLFQDDEYKLGSLSSPFAARARLHRDCPCHWFEPH
jgi:L-rhamnose isomerase/sugar isomerase